MKMRILAPMLAAMLGTLPVQAQVPPDLAAANRAIGKATDQAATAKVYGPLAETAPYAGVTVARDLAYGPYPRNMLDVFQPAAPGRPRAVVIYFSGGAQTRGSGDKNLPAAGIFYDNIMVWAARHDLVGVNTDRRAWQGAPRDAGAQDVGAAVRWVKANIARYGGDPSRIFVFGHGYGGTDVAGYLSHPALWQGPSPGVKGAILLSAPFNLAPLMGPPGARANVPMFDPANSSLEGMKALNLPIYMGSAELDEDAVRASADLLRQQLCLKACPTFDVYKDHQHISVTYSFNTADQSVSGPVLTWIRSVR